MRKRSPLYRASVDASFALDLLDTAANVATAEIHLDRLLDACAVLRAYGDDASATRFEKRAADAFALKLYTQAIATPARARALA